jgi:GINS complex subunit 2
MASSFDDGLSSFYSAFPADDLLVDIVPSLDAPQRFELLSSAHTIGPLHAGVTTQVPLWLAVFLQQRSLCRIAPPSWWSVENLSRILEFERSHVELWTVQGKLPRHYYELFQRLQSSSSLSRDHNHKAIAVLIQDIFQVRCDKLQQQFQTLLKENAGNLLVNVNGIASQELALLRPFVIQALNDQHQLSSSSNSNSGVGSSTKEGSTQEADRNETTVRPIKARVPVRRFQAN